MLLGAALTAAMMATLATPSSSLVPRAPCLSADGPIPRRGRLLSYDTDSTVGFCLSYLGCKNSRKTILDVSTRSRRRSISRASQSRSRRSGSS